MLTVVSVDRTFCTMIVPFSLAFRMTKSEANWLAGIYCPWKEKCRLMSKMPFIGLSSERDRVKKRILSGVCQGNE